MPKPKIIAEIYPPQENYPLTLEGFVEAFVPRMEIRIRNDQEGIKLLDLRGYAVRSTDTLKPNLDSDPREWQSGKTYALYNPEKDVRVSVTELRLNAIN